MLVHRGFVELGTGEESGNDEGPKEIVGQFYKGSPYLAQL